MDKKAFWYAMMAGTAGLWVVGLLVPWWIFQNRIAGLVIPLVMLLLHILELPLALNLGEGKGLPPSRSLFFTLVFGFTWWLPLRKGIIDR